MNKGGEKYVFKDIGEFVGAGITRAYGEGMALVGCAAGFVAAETSDVAGWLADVTGC